jgi:hypothetical protein
MHVCTCASAYTYLCVYVCACMYLCVFAFVSVHTGVRARMCAYESACGGCVHAQVRLCVCRLFSRIISSLETFSGFSLHTLKATLLKLKLWCFCICC